MKIKILIFGATGLLGNKLFLDFQSKKKYVTLGTCRKKNINLIPNKLKKNIIILNNLYNISKLISVFKKVKPNIVINCLGIIKQSPKINNKNELMYINGFFPHILSFLCIMNHSRLFHFSTDCVFSGKKGNYNENYIPDAKDLYGLSKINGEINNKNSITFRTSIIGRELRNKKSLLEWFLSQKNYVHGFTNVIFSGLPVKEIGYILDKIILSKKKLFGVYHLSSQPISKFNLLILFNARFKKSLNILRNNKICINRSLNSRKLNKAINYRSKNWKKLVKLI